MRWRALAGVVAAVGAALVPGPVGAQAPPPTLTLSPTSGGVGTLVTATLSPPMGCSTFVVDWDQPYRRFTGNASTQRATFRVPSGSNIGFHDVVGICNPGDPEFGVKAAASFRVTYPTTVSVSPNCGPSRTRNRVTVSGQGFQAAVFIFFDGQQVGSADPQPPAGSFSVVVTFPATTEGTHVVEAVDDLDNAARTSFIVPCPTTTVPTMAPSTTATTAPPTTAPATTTTLPFVPPSPGPTPTLRIEPALGPPGFAPVAIGQGFAPFAEVTLTWAPGLGGTRVATDATGSFRVSVLVLRKDRLGPRLLNAAGTAGTASAPYLVVPPSVQPPRFTFRR